MAHSVQIASRVLALVALCLSGCTPSLAPMTPQPPPVPDTVEVQAWTQTSRSGAQQVVFVRNLSPQPIEIYELTVYGCANIVGTCQTSAPNVIVAPGTIERLTEVVRLDRALPYTFQYNYKWRNAGGSR